MSQLNAPVRAPLDSQAFYCPTKCKLWGKAGALHPDFIYSTQCNVMQYNSHNTLQCNAVQCNSHNAIGRGLWTLNIAKFNCQSSSSQSAPHTEKVNFWRTRLTSTSLVLPLDFHTFWKIFLKNGISACALIVCFMQCNCHGDITNQAYLVPMYWFVQDKLAFTSPLELICLTIVVVENTLHTDINCSVSGLFERTHSCVEPIESTLIVPSELLVVTEISLRNGEISISSKLSKT